jgi:hypothetical protein
MDHVFVSTSLYHFHDSRWRSVDRNVINIDGGRSNNSLDVAPATSKSKRLYCRSPRCRVGNVLPSTESH